MRDLFDRRLERGDRLSLCGADAQEVLAQVGEQILHLGRSNA